MKLYQILYFQQVCRSGNNISRASKELHVSQPSVSNAIKDLESQFGIALFSRINNRLFLTKAGEHFLTLIDSLLEKTREIELEMKSFKNIEAVLKIGVPPMEFSGIYPMVLEDFAIRFPDIKIEIYDSGDMLELIREEIIDVAFLGTNGLDLRTFNTHLVKRTSLNLFVNENHPLRHAKVINKEEINELPMVLFDNNRLKAYLLKNQMYPDMITFSNQLSTMLQMVRMNKATTVLLEDVKTSNVIHSIPIAGLSPINIEMVWKKNKIQKPAMKWLISFIVEVGKCHTDS